MKGIKGSNARTNYERYNKIIGYQFGTDDRGNRRIYNGGYWDEKTGKKQYEFIYYNDNDEIISQHLTDYRGFRDVIDKYDYPRK